MIEHQITCLAQHMDEADKNVADHTVRKAAGKSCLAQTIENLNSFNICTPRHNASFTTGCHAPKSAMKVKEWVLPRSDVSSQHCSWQHHPVILKHRLSEDDGKLPVSMIKNI